MSKHILSKYNKSFPFIVEGFVVSTEDPDQMGRLKIWCPGIDADDYQVDQLPWAEYASPFGGITQDFPAGRNSNKSTGQVAYGFWAIPKLNAQVFIFFLNGNQNRRFYFASYMDLHRNRSLPGGRNLKPIPDNKWADGPWTDVYEPLEPAYTNARKAGLDKDLERGPHERQVAQARTIKDGKDGYAVSPADKYLDSQAYCWVTPGHHMFVMNDTPENNRIRVKTCEGNQIILDDTNGRIYISTSIGNSWFEMDEYGHVHIYGAKSISVRADEDVNISAERNINLRAKGGIHMRGEADVRITGGNIHLKTGEVLALTGCDVNLSGKATKISGDTLDLKSGGAFTMEGSIITAKSNVPRTDQDKDRVILPGGAAKMASCANEANGPSIIPNHEPFKRPENKGK